MHSFIRNYHICRYAKVFKNQYNNFLKPLLILAFPWIDVILDFMTGLSSNNSYNVVLIIINQLTKEKYYILYTTDKNNTTTKAIAYLLLNNV